MDVKKFFQPTKLKIFITLILLFLPLILQFFLYTLFPSGFPAYGFPLPVIQLVSYQCMLGDPCPESHYILNPPSLIVDLLILYLATLLIIFIYKTCEKISKNKYSKSLLLALSLFVMFTIISYVFSIGYPLLKAMIGIGLPLIFYAYDPWTGEGIHLGKLFFWNYLLIDIVYWYVTSSLIIWAHKKFRYEK